MIKLAKKITEDSPLWWLLIALGILLLVYVAGLIVILR